MADTYDIVFPFSLAGEAQDTGAQVLIEEQQAKWLLLDARISLVVVVPVATGDIAGFAFSDDDGDGTQTSPESGVAGVELLVTDSEATPYTVFTDANGLWNLTDLPVGTVTVAVVAAPANFNIGNINTEYPFVDTISETTPLDAPELDMVPLTGGVTGVVYDDQNASGTLNAGEPGIQGVELQVTDSALVNHQVFTDVNGLWTVLALPAGAATVSIIDTTASFEEGNEAANYPYNFTVTLGTPHQAPALDLVASGGGGA